MLAPTTPLHYPYVKYEELFVNVKFSLVIVGRLSCSSFFKLFIFWSNISMFLFLSFEHRFEISVNKGNDHNERDRVRVHAGVW